MSTLRDTLQEALAHHHAGRFHKAEAIYQSVLSARPGHGETSHLLGLLYYQSGRLEEALRLLRQAVQVQPSNCAYLNALGVTLLALRRIDEAKGLFARACALKPDYADGHSNLASALCEEGRYQESAASCRRALALKPHHADALYNLGNALCALGQVEEAIAAYRQATSAKAGFARAHNNLAGSLTLAGRFAEAIEEYRRAIRLDPMLAEAHKNLGSLLKDQGRRAEAIEAFQEALRARPDYPDALNRLGIALVEEERWEEAMACYQRALALQPDFAEAQNNLGTLYLEQERYTEAEAWYRRALAERPLVADLHYNLGNALKLQERLAEAVASYRRALELDPRHSRASNNLGNALKLLGRVSEAIEAYEEGLKHDPGELNLVENLAASYKQMGLCQEAAQWYRKALPRRAGSPLYELRTDNLCPPVFSSREELEAYRAGLEQAIERYVAMEVRVDPAEIIKTGCEPPFDAAYQGFDERPMRERYARIFRHCFTPGEPKVGAGRPRVGLVVTRDHEGIFLRGMRGIVERVEPERIDLAVVCAQSSKAKLEGELRREGLEVVPIADEFKAAAQTIREARFDVLFFWEVGSDPFNYFLPFLRLAPVQCVGWGTNYTSGVPAVDYLVSSELVEPPGSETQYVERLVRLKTLPTYQERPARTGPPRKREHFGLLEREHVYLCAQNLRKFHPDFDAALGAILRRDPAGVLALCEPEYPHMQKTLCARFARTIPDVIGRIRFLPRMPYGDYLELVAIADVVLDPFHYGSGVTAYDTFAVGRPLVTMPSAFQRGRYVLGCYRKMGLAGSEGGGEDSGEDLGCIATSCEEYVELAVRLGTDREYNRATSERIMAASAAIFDDDEAVREYEAFWESAVEEARKRLGRTDAEGLRRRAAQARDLRIARRS